MLPAGHTRKEKSPIEVLRCSKGSEWKMNITKGSDLCYLDLTLLYRQKALSATSSTSYSQYKRPESADISLSPIPAVFS